MMISLQQLIKALPALIVLNVAILCADCQTTITKWPSGKCAAVSITFDDGIRTQFTQVLPILDKLRFPGTFFIVTGAIVSSKYSAKFVGRPVGDIMNEAKNVPTNTNNFFERASAMRFLGFRGTAPFFYRAGSLFENGKLQQAYLLTDSVYSMAIAGVLTRGMDTTYEAGLSAQNSWEDFQRYAAQGHEFATHSVSHPFMAILDTANISYELEKCKEDIASHLGPANTFSAEVPFGSEDSRVMEYVLHSKLFPALRNDMPDPFLQEINRGYATQPGSSLKEYVQWQRGPLQKTPLRLMKSWVDTILHHPNIWLVLVFHGIDTLGWEPIPHEELAGYFQYIKDKESSLWVATFRDVTKYVRERMATKVTEEKTIHALVISLEEPLDSFVYDVPLTLKTYVPRSWTRVVCQQDRQSSSLVVRNDSQGTYVLYQVTPGRKTIQLSRR